MSNPTSSNNKITKSQLKTITSIKIDTDNFSWCVLNYEFIPIQQAGDHAKLKLSLVKTSKMKKIIQDNEVLTEIDPELIKTVIINLQSTEPEDQIFLNPNVVNLCNSFTKIINVLRSESN